ncbi:MAG TPA: DUF2721 domain-containing protein [Gemmatimonadaceae bacterium]|nr:DUF2721 domain-containing protein [Gemmatimonadaceae bacterium]
MQQDSSVTAVAHVIQLAVAPVFLLSGIGAILGVMTNRIARIIDRARSLQQGHLALGPGGESARLSELAALARRARLMSYSIALCTTTALLICAVIAVLFFGARINIDTSIAVVVIFIAAMATFFLGLLLFLREIFLATRTLRIGVQHAVILERREEPKILSGPED